MRILFLILIGLSLSTIAQGVMTTSSQENAPSYPQKERTGPVCDPNVTAKMPETFF